MTDPKAARGFITGSVTTIGGTTLVAGLGLVGIGGMAINAPTTGDNLLFELMMVFVQMAGALVTLVGGGMVLVGGVVLVVAMFGVFWSNRSVAPPGP